MSDPTKYDPSYSFTDYQTASPQDPLPAPQVDNEFGQLKVSIGQIVDAIKDVRRSDGALKNGIVTADSLSADVASDLGSGAGASAAAAAVSAAAAHASELAAAVSAGTAVTAASTATSSASSASVSAAAAAAAAESVSSGLKFRPDVVAATTANITLSGTQTIDGVAVLATQRVLVKNQTLPAQNGPYVCAAGAWSRATDADTWDELVSQLVKVTGGSVNGGVTFVCTVNPGLTLGTDAVTWIAFSLTPPDLSVTTGKIVDLAVTNAKLAVNAVTTTNITDANVTTAKLAGKAVTYAKIQDISANDKVLGRASGGAGSPEEIPCTAFGRSLIACADAAAGRTALSITASSGGTERVYKNLAIDNNAVTPNTKMDVSADILTLADSGHAVSIVRGLSVTVNLAAAAGINSIDTGTKAINTWYRLHAVSNGVTPGVVASLSATSPTMPAGSPAYTYSMPLHWVRTDGSGNLYRMRARGDRVTYTAGTSRTMASGAAGTFNGTTVAVATGAYVPSTATELFGTAFMNTSGSNGVGLEVYPSSVVAAPLVFHAPNSTAQATPFSCVLETTDIYWSSGGASNYLFCNGWRDQL